MEKIERPIIVPWDFSQVAENAFQHAVNMSKDVNREILLLHVVSDSKHVESVKGKLEASAEELGKEYGRKPHTKAVAGSIFNSIGKVAQEKKAEAPKEDAAEGEAPKEEGKEKKDDADA